MVPLPRQCGKEDLLLTLVCGAHTQCLIEFVLRRSSPLTLLSVHVLSKTCLCALESSQHCLPSLARCRPKTAHRSHWLVMAVLFTVLPFAFMHLMLWMFSVMSPQGQDGDRKPPSQGSREGAQGRRPRPRMRDLKECCVTVGTCVGCDLKPLSLSRPFVSCCWLHGLY